MSRSGAKSNSRIRPNLKHSILADQRREYPTLAAGHEIFHVLGSPIQVLRALDASPAESATFGAVVRALVNEIQSRRRLRIASDMIVYAFAPAIERRPLGGDRLGSLSRRDFKQQAVVSLLERAATVQLSELSDRALCKYLQKAPFRGFVAQGKRERKEIDGRRLYKEKMMNLRLEDRGAKRQRKRTRLRFDNEAREATIDVLRKLVAPDVMGDPRMDIWIATTIEGKAVREYVHERYAVNSDMESVRLANLTRKQKERFARELRKAVNGDVECNHACLGRLGPCF